MDSTFYRRSIACGLACLWGVSVAFAQTHLAWRDSLNVLNRMIAESAWSAELHLRKAAVNLELQQWEYAADEYSLVLEREPHHLAALFYRSYANRHLRRYDQARRDLEHLLSIVPRHAEARVSLAYVLQLLKRPNEAVDQLNQAVELMPDSAYVYVARAALEGETGQYDAALFDWQKACQLQPLNADYVASHAELLMQLHRFDQAQQVLDAAVQRGIDRAGFNAYYARLRKRR